MVTLEEDDPDVSSCNVTGLWTGQAAQRHSTSAMQQTQRQQKQQHQQSHGSERSLQDTADFLEGLFAASYAAQPLEDVAQCYEVLHGCPWVLPRPVFVLTSQQWGWKSADGIQSTYTLHVKVVKEGAADAIAKLLNKQHLAAALDVAEMRDGFVVFESAEDADRFASKLEEEGHSQVMVAEVDSHKVFRIVSELKALAVLLRQGVTIPAPYQLAASLKQQKSWDGN